MSLAVMVVNTISHLLLILIAWLEFNNKKQIEEHSGKNPLFLKTAPSMKREIPDKKTFMAHGS